VCFSLQGTRHTAPTSRGAKYDLPMSCLSMDSRAGSANARMGLQCSLLMTSCCVMVYAGYYKTNAWWTTARKTVIAADGLLPWLAPGAPPTTTYYPSCCALEAIGAIDLSGANEACNGLDWTVARRANKRQTAEGGAGRRLQEEGVGTANYDHTGPFYQGDATVIWGPFEAINMATGEKWENSGVCLQVFDFEHANKHQASNVWGGHIASAQ